MCCSSWEDHVKWDQFPRFDQWEDSPHVYEMQQFSPRGLEQLIYHSIRMEIALGQICAPLPRISQPRPWTVRTLFFEPSTRTETTFVNAALRLGCPYHAVKDPQTFSSMAKGESFFYTLAAHTRAGGMGHLRQADCLVIRHSTEGMSKRAAEIVNTVYGDGQLKLSLPIINAGDGAGQHPTQALVDLATIYRERQNGRHPLDDLTVLFPGDLQRSRVINSLLYAFGKFGQQHKIQVIFCCPRGFEPKQQLLEYLARHNVGYTFRNRLADFPAAIEEADITVMTRHQRERVADNKPTLSRKQRRGYSFLAQYVRSLKPGAFVMHPLPINEDPNDLPPEIDPTLAPLAMSGDPRCAWLRQSHRGLSTRTALLDIIFAGLDAEMEQIKSSS